MIRQVLAVGIFIGLMIPSPPAQAASCAKREQVVERLKARYSESLTAGGLQASRTAQTIVEVWASEETGTFTVLLTTPEGMSCVVATGTDWFQAAEVEDTSS